MNMKGKMIIDLSDPDRPQFTLHEPQSVLAERDEALDLRCNLLHWPGLTPIILC